MRRSRKKSCGLCSAPSTDRDGAGERLGWCWECPESTSPEPGKKGTCSRSCPTPAIPALPAFVPKPSSGLGRGAAAGPDRGRGLGAAWAVNGVRARGPSQPKPLRVPAAPPLSAPTGISPRRAGPPRTRSRSRCMRSPPGAVALPGGGTAAVSRRVPLLSRSHLCRGAPGPARPRRRLVPPLSHRPLRHFRPPRPARPANQRPCRRTHPHPPPPGRYHAANRVGGTPCIRFPGGFASASLLLLAQSCSPLICQGIRALSRLQRPEE